MKKTPLKKPNPNLDEIINMFWDNHNRNETIIKALINYNDKEPKTFNLATIKTEPKSVKEKMSSLHENMRSLVRKIKVDPIELGLTELPIEDSYTQENQAYQASNSCFYQDEEDKPNEKPIDHYLNKLPSNLKINAKRLLFIFSKIKEKWPIEKAYPYNNEIAFKVFELKNYNSSSTYRFVSTKQFPKYLADNYNKSQ